MRQMPVLAIKTEAAGDKRGERELVTLWALVWRHCCLRCGCLPELVTSLPHPIHPPSDDLSFQSSHCLAAAPYQAAAAAAAGWSRIRGMGRPPSSGGPAFRFTHAEVAEMEEHLRHLNNAIPHRDVIQGLADKFTASPARGGKISVQPKQVWNWFQNRRYSQRNRTTRGAPLPQGKMLPTGAADEHHSASFRAQSASSVYPTGKNSSNGGQVDFEAKSARDGAWYDVAHFLSHRLFETGEPEVRVRFSGFGAEEDEWINVRKCVRQRSLPCEPTECVAVLPGDLILCFQEGKEQALYFDARILDAQRRRHDVRGCRCRFLVRYDHDHSEEIVPLRKVCRRPDNGFRQHILHANRVAASAQDVHMGIQIDRSSAEQKPHKPHKMMDVNTDEVTMVPKVEPTDKPVVCLPAASTSTRGDSSSDVTMRDAGATPEVEAADEGQGDKMNAGE